MKKQKLFFDAWSLIDPHVSGIGHATHSLIKEIAAMDSGYEIIVVIPRGGEENLKRWALPPQVKVKVMPLFRRVFNRLSRYNLLPPIDLLIGRGIYIFPNYRNWNLWRSKSYTFIHDISFVRYPQFTEPRNQ